ncbi:MAG TPA: BTAD domain-containing putative transcriptional regulator, partial [Micromonosporaceae bacterium]
LDDRRLEIWENCLDAELRADPDHRPVDELRRLVAEHPYRERLAGLLMTALARAGLQAEALAVYRATRDRLHEELGVDPGPALEAIHRSVLSGAGIAAGTAVRLLPTDPAGFAGRVAQLQTLDATASTTSSRPRLIAISGMGGVGKTALAVRWAYRSADHFPDGLICLDLRGHGHGAPLTVVQARALLLVALGLAPGEVPADPDTAEVVYRQQFAGRRLLLILDNAAGEDQVRALLPTEPTTTTLVTSRRTLAGLVVHDGAESLPLEVLLRSESHALLEALLPGRHSADLDRLATSCGHLPLAIRIAAALVTTGATDLPQLLIDLTERRRLAVLAVDGDAASTVATVIASSYDRLTVAQRRAFRLLGAGPCVTYSTESAAAATGEPAAQMADMLHALLDAHLLTVTASGHFGFHDLVREYAASNAAADEAAAATTRLLDAYIHFAETARATLFREYRSAPPTVPAPADPILLPTDFATGVRALHADLDNIAAVVARADHIGRDDAVWEIPHRLSSFLNRYARRDLALQLGIASAAAAARLKDPIAERRGLAALGLLYNNMSQSQQAIAVLERSLDLAVEQQDPNAEATARNNLGISYKTLGDYETALAYYQQSLELRANMPANTRIATLSNIGAAHMHLGEYAQAETYLIQALETVTNANDPARVGVLCNLACLYLEADRLELARSTARTARDAALAADYPVRAVSASVTLARASLHAPDEAERLLLEAIEAARAARDARLTCEALLALGELRLATGDRA